MDPRRASFSLSGGFLNGQIVRGDVADKAERDRVDCWLWFSGQGTVGRRFWAAMDFAPDEIPGKVPASEATQKYEVVRREEREDGSIVVHCVFIGPA
jgi:hypothetical protein